jgi:enoyl-CoA hydratase
MDYRDYQHLLFERRPNGVVLVTINRPEVLNATNDRLHWELTQVWLTLDADDSARVAVVTGAGRAFSAGGDLDMVEANSRDPKRLASTMREASDIVYNMINLEKPVISAINGVAVGAGLVVALLSDISIISETARFTDGHTKLGVVAGDHAAIVWPLLCGMAKAKYYLLTSDFIDGREAERIGWSACACRPPTCCRRPSRWPTSSPPARSRPSAGPSARSTTGCAWPDPSSTSRSRSRCSASWARTCARARPRSARSGRRAFPPRTD